MANCGTSKAVPKAVAGGGWIVYNVDMKTIAVYVPLLVAVALGVCPASASAQMLAQPARRVVAPVRPVRPVAPARPAVGPLRRSYGPQWGGWGGWGGWMYTNVYEGPDSLHRPWAGSDTYYKNLGRRSQDGGRADAQGQSRQPLLLPPPRLGGSSSAEGAESTLTFLAATFFGIIHRHGRRQFTIEST